MLNHYIHLLYSLSTVTIASFAVNYICRHTINNHYSYWIDCLLLANSLFITALFQNAEIQFVLILFWGLFALSLMDIFYRVLPDIINYTLLIFGLALSFQHQFISITQSILGVLVGYMVLWSFSFAYKHLTGQLGIGGGDLKLTAALGAWIGFEGIFYLLFWSSLLGCGFFWIMAMKGKYNRLSKIPFGVFLSIVGMGIFTLRFSVWR